jgi:hypothetical protein
MYLIVSTKGGISSVELKRHLGFGSDETAWNWLHKLRLCMASCGLAPLEADVVEVAAATAKEPPCDSVVACALERKVSGRVRQAVIVDSDEAKLKALIRGDLELEGASSLHAWLGYAHKRRGGYVLLSRICEGKGRTPACGALELLKRLFIATYHGAVSRKHLPRYLTEYAFRFNRRSSAAPTDLFQQLMQGAVKGGRVSCWTLAGKALPGVPLTRR